MGFRNLFGLIKSEPVDVQDPSVVQIGLKDIRSALENDGYETQMVDQIVNGLESRFADKIKEKSTLDYDEFMSEVTREIQGVYNLPDERLKLCKRIDDFLKCNPEIQNSIRLYASYIVYGSSEAGADEYTVIVTGDDQDEVPKARSFITHWEHKTKIRRYLYLIAKDVVSYGDAFMEKVFVDGKLDSIGYAPSNSFLMKIEGTETPLNYYQVIHPGVTFTDIQVPTTLSTLLAEKKIIEFQPEEIAHFSDGTLPGTIDAPLGSLTLLWRFMRLIEEAFVIHRVTRARRMIIFFLDVTGKSKEQIRKAVGNFTSKLKSIFSIRPDSGSIHEVRSNIPSSSDLVIPVTKESATKIQPISSDPSAAKIDDLRFYLNRILSNMLTLHIFTTSEKSENTEPMERALSRIIKIYQKQLSYTLQDLYQEVLDSNDFENMRVTIEFPAIDNRQETEMVESVVRRAMILNQLVSILGYAPPSEWSVRYIFKDIASAELEELIELIKIAEKQQAEEAAKQAEAEASAESTPAPESLSLVRSTNEQAPPNNLQYSNTQGENPEEQQPKISLLHSSSASGTANKSLPSTSSLPDELVYGIGKGLAPGTGAVITEKVQKDSTPKLPMSKTYDKEAVNKALDVAISYISSMKRK
jgi:hypothetical protein